MDSYKALFNGSAFVFNCVNGELCSEHRQALMNERDEASSELSRVKSLAYASSDEFERRFAEYEETEADNRKLRAELASVKSEMIRLVAARHPEPTADYELELTKNAVLTQCMLAVAEELKAWADHEDKWPKRQILRGLAELLEDARAANYKVGA